MFNYKLEEEVKKLKRLNKKRKEEIKDLEGRIFEKKEFNPYTSMGTWVWGMNYIPSTLEEEINELAEKLDAVVSKMGLVIKKQEKSEKWVANKKRGKKK